MDASPRLLTRRGFLTASAAILVSSRVWAESGVKVPAIGTCGSIDQAVKGRAAGLSFIEVGLVPNCAPSVPEEAFQKWLGEVRAAVLPASRANVFFPGDIKLVGPKRDLGKVRDYANGCLARAVKAGVKIVTLGSGGARSMPEGTSVPEAVAQFTESCREIAKVAKKHGITVAVEPLNKGECNFLNRLSEVCEVVDAVNSPNLGATADIYHMRREKEGADALLAAGKRVRHCHIAEDKDRRAPGGAGDDFTDYFAALQTFGYEGGISIECTWTEVDAELPVAVAEISKQWLRAANKKSHG